jgi:hypothetical protein
VDDARKVRFWEGVLEINDLDTLRVLFLNVDLEKLLSRQVSTSIRVQHIVRKLK